jgi:hypothetical protein
MAKLITWFETASSLDIGAVVTVTGLLIIFLLRFYFVSKK